MREDQKILDMTPGLLASAMLRSDHSIFMGIYSLPENLAKVMQMDPETRIPQLMDKVIRKYGLAKQGTLEDIQILEEFTGCGFYKPDAEESYVSMLAQFPGAKEMANEKIALIV